MKRKKNVFGMKQREKDLFFGMERREKNLLLGGNEEKRFNAEPVVNEEKKNLLQNQW